MDYPHNRPCNCDSCLLVTLGNHASDLETRVSELEAELRDALEDHDCEYADGDGSCAKCARLAELNR